MMERYTVHKFGVEAEISVSPQDIEIMTLIGQTVVILHTLAEKMNHFQGLMESTRHVIKGCRNLASDLQEEIELRRGPQG